ncbi:MULTISPECIES: cytochrome c [Bacillales]|uniref:Cytochrome c n=1 Tax=Lysinibacillus louembei TaxID=1470088 RepID=A0ABZ0RYT7_9BACI|nr:MULTISPECIES: cytochrome c [Bacillales]MCT6923767.1 cytochrome c [Metasolibacillus sp.]MCT6940000.1 cytochrome c [Metasolibacillus sp.]WPK13393.1 cytochrome c [Lysinibacillus louembei]
MMTKRFMHVVLAGGLAVFGLAACGGGDKAKEEKPDSSTDTVATGESVAKAQCIGCHGGDLTGGMGPNLHGLTLSKEEIVDILKNGKGAMPAGAAKGNEEAVADYILTLK